MIPDYPRALFDEQRWLAIQAEHRALLEAWLNRRAAPIYHPREAGIVSGHFDTNVFSYHIEMWKKYVGVQ